MEYIIHFFILTPFVAFILSLFISEKKEKLIAGLAFYAAFINAIAAIIFLIFWIWQGAKPFNMQDLVLYKTNGFNFFIDFYFDHVSATYLITGNLIFFLVIAYSRNYMHKESGFKRFFNTTLFFYTGYLITVLAGNFETLFIGWEILGLSSFLLIAFYRMRYLPVKNALKVFTIYRIGDVGILLAMWMSHHLWHENITFIKLHNYDLVHEQLMHHSGIGIFISCMILLAALAKSAQLPFSAWLPRAMEGPTPSSAVFYGSLSVHIGAFLLLRTHPFWEHQTLVRWIIALFGLSTAIVTSMIARVQSTVKGQIAYSSASQIGIIFIEIAAGLEAIALLHFVGNAFLRTYQLLISPSVVTYLVREQFYNYQFKPKAEKSNFATRLKTAFYLLSIKEWNLDSIVFRIILKPLKSIKGFLAFLNIKMLVFFLLPVYLIGNWMANSAAFLPLQNYLAIAAGLMALLMVSKAYNERKSTELAWLLTVFAHFFIDLAVTFNVHHLDLKEAFIYLSGILVSGIFGFWVIYRLRVIEKKRISLNQFHGLVHSHKLLAFLFLLSCLGVAGFPITTAFFGEDLILTHIQENQILLATIVSLTFVVNGISVIRMYARLFLGNLKRNYQTSTSLTY